MKSRTASLATELVGVPDTLVWIHSGPTPAMNSRVGESVQGFLNKRSVAHSVVAFDQRIYLLDARGAQEESCLVCGYASVGPKPERFCSPRGREIIRLRHRGSIAHVERLSSWSPAAPRRRRERLFHAFLARSSHRADDGTPTAGTPGVAAGFEI